MLNKNTKKSKKGFTLTEVLVVVLIIGVISAIAYPVYTKSINKSRAVEAINLLEMVRNKQIANYARKGEYLPTFSNIGQLTSNADAEVKTEGDAILTVNGKYELAINSATNCMSAAYIPAKGKPATFTFSSSYEDAGLGCDGDVCKTFGNIVGSSSSVCNCGDKSCSSPYNLNSKTCNCDCPLACSDGGCHDKNPARTETRACGNGGTQTRTCPESCSSECNTSWSSCTGQKCDGNASEPCDAGYSGTKTRTCNNGVWSGWNTSGCTKDPIECSGAAAEACGNCGTKSRTCDKTTGNWSAWSACTGTKDETSTCDEGYTGNKTRTCTNDVWAEWDRTACIKKEIECDANAKPAETDPCHAGCGTRIRTVDCDKTVGAWQTGAWNESACSAPAQNQPTSQNCGNGTQYRTCRASCGGGECDGWGACNCNSGYVLSGGICASCNDNSIRAANKSKCCPSAAQSDDICYKDCYKWECGSGSVSCVRECSYIGGCPSGCYYFPSGGGSCTDNCRGITDAMQNSTCKGKNGAECSASDAMNYGEFSTPCNYAEPERTESSGWETYILSLKVYNCFCKKTSPRCKNGW